MDFQRHRVRGRHQHRQKLLEYFGFDEHTRTLGSNGDRCDHEDDAWASEKLTGKAATEYRGLAARLNYMSLDCPDLQFPIKQCSREMASPTNGSLGRLKKIVRYLCNREKIVWKFAWQDEPTHGILYTDSDWGGDRVDRKSSSGGVFN